MSRAARAALALHYASLVLVLGIAVGAAVVAMAGL